MTNGELEQQGAPHPSSGRDGFVDSFGFFALAVMSFFVAATALAIVGFTSPHWLGFS
jgi:hypothetical protein